MQVKNLAAAADFVVHGVDHDFFIVGFDDGLNRVAVRRGGLDHAEVARSGERHVERPRNGRGAHREYVDRGAHGFEGFLVFHAEALLFVDYDEAELAEFHVFLENAVSADEDVHLPGGDGFEDFLLLGARAKSADHLDGNRVAGHPFAK